MKIIKEISNFCRRAFHKHKKALGIIILCLFLMHDIVFAYNNLQNKAPIIGLRFENHFLIGASHAQLEKIIAKEEALHNRPLFFTHKNKTISISQKEIGYTVNKGYVANSLLLEGRKGTIFDRFWGQEKTLFGFNNQHIHGTTSPSLLMVKIVDLQAQIDLNPQPISLDFAHDMHKIIPAHNGEKIQTDKLSLLITHYISDPPKIPLPLPTYTSFVNQHTTQELNPIRDQAARLLVAPIGIISGGLSFTLTPEELKNMLTVVERPDPVHARKTILSLRLDDIQLNQKLGAFAVQVENTTHAEFDDHEARVALYAQFYNPQSPRFLSIPTGRRLTNPNVLGITDHPGTKIAYLTFDDGPNAIYHPMILDILRAYNIKATFFLVGKNVSQAHDVAIATVTDGHLIGNHSLTHSFLPNLRNLAIVDELDRTDNILQSITSKPITFFRPPYGGINQTVIADAHQRGLRIFLWDVDPRDWSEPSVDELVNRVVSATHDGSDILLHSNHLVTTRALPKIIETLQSQGYIFKTLDTYPQKEQL